MFFCLLLYFIIFYWNFGVFLFFIWFLLERQIQVFGGA